MAGLAPVLVMLILLSRRDILLPDALMYGIWRVFSAEPEVPVAGALGFVLVLVLLSPIMKAARLVRLLMAGLAVGIPLLFVMLSGLHTLSHDITTGAVLQMVLPRQVPIPEFTMPHYAMAAVAMILAKGYLAKGILGGERSRFSRILETLALGLGITSLQSMTLSMFFGMNWTNLVLSEIMVLAVLVVSYSAIRPGARPHGFAVPPPGMVSVTERIGTWGWLKILFLSSSVVLAGYYALPAITEWDSLAYIATQAKAIFLDGRSILISGSSIGLEISSAYPTGYASLIAYFYRYVGGVSEGYATTLTPVFMALSLAAVYGLGRIFFPRQDALTVAVVVAATPLFAYHSVTSGHYILYTLLFTTLATGYSVRFVQTGLPRTLLAASIFAGFATLSSYLALPAFLIPALALLVKRSRVGAGILAMIPGAAIPLPYMARNLYALGDPVYPLFSAMNDRFWMSTEAHFRVQTIHAGVDLLSPFSLSDFLFMRPVGLRPWLVVTLILLPIILIHLWRGRGLGGIDRKEKFLLALFWLSMLIFLTRPTFERYFLPYLGISSAVLVWVYKAAASRGFGALRTGLRVLIVVSAGFTLSLYMIIPNAAPSLGYLETDSKESTLAYLESYYPEAPAWAWINSNTPRDAKIATYDIKYYYLDREVVPLDSKIVAFLYDPQVSAEEAIKMLRGIGVQYVLSTSWAHPQNQATPPLYFENGIVRLLGDPSYLPPVFVRNGIAVYHVGPIETMAVVKDFLSKGRIPPFLETETELSLHGYRESDILEFDVPNDYLGRTRVAVWLETENTGSELIVKDARGDRLPQSSSGQGRRGEVVFFPGRDPGLAGKYTVSVQGAEGGSLSVMVEITALTRQEE